MNCEKCQELLSDYLDDALENGERAMVAAHLGACAECAEVREEFRSILSIAHASREFTTAPPDEHALWLRIRDAVEHDESYAPIAAAQSSRARARESFLTRLFTKRWELSLPQLASGVAAIAVAVALVTTLGVQRLSTVRDAEKTSLLTAPGRDGVARAGAYPQTYLQPHQANLQYWQQRVEQTKASWNPRMRQSFDRSVSVLDETVTESLGELERNPHDEVAEQMLNAALRDKVELLRAFGEQ